MKIVETLFPVAVVVALVVNYLQGYYGAKGRVKEKQVSSGVPVPFSAGLPGRDVGANERQVDPVGESFITAELPRGWLDTAMPKQDPNWAEQSIDWSEDRRFSESLEASHACPVDDHHLQNEFGLINPATGLPMLGDGPVDIAGNAYGENGSQQDWSSASHDSLSSDSDGSSSWSSSWDDHR